MIEALPFGPGALIFVAVYILSLLGIGFYAYKQRQKDNMQDFFLAGRNLGFTILFLTLYATQYSGNTLLGFSGATYRNGLSFLVCVHFMTAIVVCYLLFAPQLYRLSRQNQFLTPGDFIFHRYQNQLLRILVTLIMKENVQTKFSMKDHLQLELIGRKHREIVGPNLAIPSGAPYIMYNIELVYFPHQVINSDTTLIRK